jgi:mannosyltransferase OCH1-like enzyme
MKIPKIIHLVWFGGQRPEKFDILVNEIKRINHDYEIYEWNDNNINFQLKNYKLFSECKNLGAKSDIFRFEVLHELGGIYMDYDFIQIKKFDDLLMNDFFIGTSSCCPNESWNSIIGATKNNEICKKFLDGLSNTKPIDRHQIQRVMEDTGPEYLTKLLKDGELDGKYKKFIGPYFFPFPADERFGIRELRQTDIDYCKSFSTDETYCIHLHTTTWQ